MKRVARFGGLPLLLIMSLLTGCTSTRPSATPPAALSERVAFTTSADRVQVVDQATAALVAHNFTITLVNERIGLLQTDYVPLTALRPMVGDSLLQRPGMADLLMRVTLNTESGEGATQVQMQGTFQRLGRGPASADPLIGLYGLEQVAQEVARSLNARYTPQVTNEVYQRALLGGGTASLTPRAHLSRAMRAVGIVAAVLFATTLAISGFGPGSTR
jgi:hypothetical protein